MRGKGECHIFGDRPAGITPAYAGKSQRQLHTQGRCQDHPRLCGEKVVSSAFLLSSLGSPPPMRGKVFMSQFSGSEIRITPAYAGKSTKYEYGERELGDHPRLCGEKIYNRR